MINEWHGPDVHMSLPRYPATMDCWTCARSIPVNLRGSRVEMMIVERMRVASSDSWRAEHQRGGIDGRIRQSNESGCFCLRLEVNSIKMTARAEDSAWWWVSDNK